MPCTPVLVSLLVGSLLCLMVWGFWQAGDHHQMSEASNEASEVVLLALLILAVLSLGVFLADVVLSTHAPSFVHFTC